MRGMDRRELAKAAREAHLLVLVQRLRTQQDHEMLVPRVFDLPERLFSDRLRRIDAADFRAERGRKRDDLYSHGMSEAWITSGTPCPPTDLIARSTSFRPKRWVVIFSSGKRFDANCASASSHARYECPRALLRVIAFTVTRSSGKFGNSFSSPCTTIVPALRFIASTPSKMGIVPAPAVQSSTTSTPLPAVISLIRASGSSLFTSMTKSAPSSFATLRRAASFDGPVMMMSEAPACLQITVCESP